MKITLAMALVGCGGSSSTAAAPSSRGPVRRSSAIDAHGRFGPYVLGMPFASAPGVSDAQGKYGNLAMLTEPFVYAGVPTKVMLFPDKNRNVRTVALQIERAKCDAVLAEMTKELGPPGRVRTSNVSVAGEPHTTSVSVWRGEKVGITLENAALACSASAVLLDGYEDLGGDFAED